MTTKTNNAEGGTAGAAVTTGNSGGTSGNAWDVVSAPGGAITYDTASALHGSLGLKFVPASGQQAVVRHAGFASATGVARVGLKNLTLPAANEAVLAVCTAADGPILQVQVTSTGHYTILDSTYAFVASTTAVYASGDRFEVSWTVATTSTGAYVFKLFRGDSTTAVETLTASNVNFGTTNWGYYQPGKSSTSTWVGPFALDDLYGQDATTTLPGPAATTGAPTANAGADVTGIAAGTTVTRTGAASGGTASGYTYAWRIVTDPSGQVILSGATTATVAFTAPATLTGATVTLGLTVTDGGSAHSTEDTVTFTVQPRPSDVVWTKPYPGGFRNKPSTASAFTAAVGNSLQDGIAAAIAQANLALRIALGGGSTSTTASGYYPPPSLAGLTVVDYASLPGATPANFADTLAAVSTNTVVRLLPDTDYYINHDFTMAGSLAAAFGYACYAPHVIGLVCDGTTDPTKRARIHMGANAMGTAVLAAIPADNAGGVNNFWALRIGPGDNSTPTYFHGVELIGHDQRTDTRTGLPANWNGIQHYQPGPGTRMSWCKFRGFSQGTKNYPPGETNQASTYNGAAYNCFQVEVDGVNGDGRRSGSAFSANGCLAVYWEDVNAHDSAVSGITFSTAGRNCGSVHLVRLVERNQANHTNADGQSFGCFNAEGVDGPITLEQMDVLNPLDYSPGYAAIHAAVNCQTGSPPSGGADITIVDPVWHGLSEPGLQGLFTVQIFDIYPPGTGQANKQTKRPTITLNGVTLTAVDSTVVYGGGSFNPATQYALKRT